MLQAGAAGVNGSTAGRSSSGRWNAAGRAAIVNGMLQVEAATVKSEQLRAEAAKGLQLQAK